jgi:predicted dehydrogenase
MVLIGSNTATGRVKEEKPRMAERVLRWGILSTADIARKKVVPGMRKAARCEVVAVGSRDGEQARGFAQALGIARAHDSYEALLADPDVDAVYIPLPNHLHREWTIAAARAGKHVLCEKPLALTASEAEEMVEACEREGVRLMEAFMYRLHPSWAAARQLLASGRIGRLQTVQSWFSYYNDDPRNIRNIAEAGGGALYDIGCYTINLSRMLFGAEPERVEAAILRDPDMEIDVLTSGLLVFPGGGTATFTVSTRSESDQRVHIYGTEGRISIGIPFNIPPDRPTQIFVTQGGDPPVAPNTETLTFPTADPYTVETEAFAAAILDGTPTPTPPADGVANLRVIEAVFAAADGRGAQGVPASPGGVALGA